MKTACLVLVIIMLVMVPFIPWISSIVHVIQFDAQCGDYLSMAADATNIDIAEKHLSTAINYIERNDLTHGYTKIVVYYPKNDIGLWYENLKTAQEQLQEMQGTDYTELEQSNMLMKLREVLLNDEGGVTVPFGISMADNFALMFWLDLLLWLPCWFIAGILGILGFDC